MKKFRITFIRIGIGKNNAGNAQTIVEAQNEQDAEKKFYRTFGKKYATIIGVYALPVANR